MFFLGCTQRECQISKDIVDNYREMFESRFLLEPRKNNRPELQVNLMQKQYLLGPMTRRVTPRNVWKDFE